MTHHAYGSHCRRQLQAWHLLAIMERQTKLLGLDAPTKHERWVHTPEKVTSFDLDREIARLTAELEKANGDQPPGHLRP